MFVTIDGTEYATFEWGAGEVKMKPLLKNWLTLNAGSEYEKTLNGWINSDNTWMTFEWNDPFVGRQFKEFFTDWNPSMKFKVLIANTRPMSRKIDLEPEISLWIKERDLIVGVDYAMAPHMDDCYRDPWPILFEFKDPKLAMIFKLTWGGNVDL